MCSIPQQTAHKLLSLSVRLKELGHPQCVVKESLNCSISGVEANQKVCLGGWVWSGGKGGGKGACECGIYILMYVYI